VRIGGRGRCKENLPSSSLWVIDQRKQAAADAAAVVNVRKSTKRFFATSESGNGQTMRKTSAIFQTRIEKMG